MLKKTVAFCLAAMMVLAVAGCDKAPASSSAPAAPAAPASSAAPEATGPKPLKKEEIKVGFVYVGDINDGGYTENHDKGRLALEAAGYPCLYKENVPESSECATAIRELIDAGCNVIYTTSFGHMDSTVEVAKEHPDLYFAHATGYATLPNLSNYMGRIIEPRYLSGIVAGMASKTGKLGYVVAKPIPEVIRGLNAFALGAQSVNPEITVEAIFTNTWYDVAIERQAAIELINKGCDVIAQHQDSTACQLAAEEKGVLAVGYNGDTPDAAPKAYLTAPCFNWAAFYASNVQAIVDGTWKTESLWEGLGAGWVDLAPLSGLCPEGAQEKVDAAKADIISGKLKLFSGEIKDQSGAVKAKDMTDEEIYGMDWFIHGVIGTIPA